MVIRFLRVWDVIIIIIINIITNPICANQYFSKKRRFIQFYEKKKILKRRKFVVEAIIRSHIKESEMIYTNLDLDEEMKNLWNTKVMVITIVVGVLRTIPEAWQWPEETRDLKENRDYPDCMCIFSRFFFILMILFPCINNNYLQDVFTLHHFST